MKNMNSISTNKFSHFSPSHCLPIPYGGELRTKVHLFTWNHVYTGLQILISCSVWTTEAKGLQVTYLPRVSPRKAVHLSLPLHIPETIWGTGKTKTYYFHKKYSKIPSQVSYRSLAWLCLAFDNLMKH